MNNYTLERFKCYAELLTVGKRCIRYLAAFELYAYILAFIVEEELPDAPPPPTKKERRRALLLHT